MPTLLLEFVDVYFAGLLTSCACENCVWVLVACCSGVFTNCLPKCRVCGAGGFRLCVRLVLCFLVCVVLLIKCGRVFGVDMEFFVLCFVAWDFV